MLQNMLLECSGIMKIIDLSNSSRVNITVATTTHTYFFLVTLANVLLRD